jgi:hypothetical protein
MINPSRLDKLFKQSCDSCVLASYSIVANYFTGISIHSFFSAYCHHYYRKIDQQDAELLYYEHFKSFASDQNGYNIILNLHKNSDEPEFKKARSLFSVEFFQVASSSFNRIEKTLLEEPALLNLTIGHEKLSGSLMAPVRQLICHSVTVFHDGVSLYKRDTGMDTGQNITPISSLRDVAQTRDAVLYRKI